MASASMDTALLVCRCGEWHWPQAVARYVVVEAHSAPSAGMAEPGRHGKADPWQPNPQAPIFVPRGRCVSGSSLIVERKSNERHAPWPPWSAVAAGRTWAPRAGLGRNLWRHPTTAISNSFQALAADDVDDEVHAQSSLNDCKNLVVVEAMAVDSRERAACAVVGSALEECPPPSLSVPDDVGSEPVLGGVGALIALSIWRSRQRDVEAHDLARSLEGSFAPSSSGLPSVAVTRGAGPNDPPTASLAACALNAEGDKVGDAERSGIAIGSSAHGARSCSSSLGTNEPRAGLGNNQHSGIDGDVAEPLAVPSVGGGIPVAFSWGPRVDLPSTAHEGWLRSLACNVRKTDGEPMLAECTAWQW
jgi:hypothetical protein